MKVKLTCGFDVNMRLRKNPPHVHKPGICFSTEGLDLKQDEIYIEPSESEESESAEESEVESESTADESSESETASESSEDSESKASASESEVQSDSE